MQIILTLWIGIIFRNIQKAQNNFLQIFIFVLIFLFNVAKPSQKTKKTEQKGWTKSGRLLLEGNARNNVST